MERAARDPDGLDLATATDIPEAENLRATDSVRFGFRTAEGSQSGEFVNHAHLKPFSPK